MSFSINPREYGIRFNEKPTHKVDLTRISNMKEVYSEELAPTSISVGYDNSRETVIFCSYMGVLIQYHIECCY